MKCPPCSGNCGQGRACPNVSRHDGRYDTLILRALFCAPVAIVVGFVLICRFA